VLILENLQVHYCQIALIIQVQYPEKIMRLIASCAY